MTHLTIQQFDDQYSLYWVDLDKFNDSSLPDDEYMSDDEVFDAAFDKTVQHFVDLGYSRDSIMQTVHNYV